MRLWPRAERSGSSPGETLRRERPTDPVESSLSRSEPIQCTHDDLSEHGWCRSTGLRQQVVRRGETRATDLRPCLSNPVSRCLNLRPYRSPGVRRRSQYRLADQDAARRVTDSQRLVTGPDSSAPELEE